MPIPFDRFRLLNDTENPKPIRFRNESDKPVQVRPTEEAPPQVIDPGQEMELPQSEAGECIIEVPDGT
jgi:hypothetical protein